ncbi:hypothetical protein K1719_011562 [Acacia pycnantha]|nr:hypothetical protein K1719_011562 [Acacia pycnantha]
MGRVKLKIKKLENISNRQVTFSKRKSGILKKAKELSILCDIDIALLMFSPTGKAILLQGERSNLEEVIEKFAQLSAQERAKRKLESLEALKKTFKKLDHDVKIQDFLGSSSQRVEELTHHVRMLQAHLADSHQRLSYWDNIEKINNVEPLRQMEESLKESINRVRLHKENLGKHHIMSLECANQLQEGMTLPMMMAGLQEAQPLSWLLNNDNNQLIMPSEPKFLPYSDNPNRGAECSINVSLPDYSGYASTCKLEAGNSAQVATLGQGGGTMNEFSEDPSLKMNINSGIRLLHLVALPCTMRMATISNWAGSESFSATLILRLLLWEPCFNSWESQHHRRRFSSVSVSRWTRDKISIKKKAWEVTTTSQALHASKSFSSTEDQAQFSSVPRCSWILKILLNRCSWI